MSRFMLKRQRGLTLVEMMISLVLGLMIIGAAIAVFISNQKVFTSNSAMSQVQDNARIAFELIARDLRQAGGTGCGTGNLTTDASAAAFVNFAQPVMGYDGGTANPDVTTGTDTGERLTSQSSIQLIGTGYIHNSINSIVIDTTNNTTDINLNQNSEFDTGDLIIICDRNAATITQISAAPDTDTITIPGSTATFTQNSVISNLTETNWYIGTNAQDGKSLYRRALITTAGTPTLTTQEMVRGVTGLQILYHAAGSASYATAATTTTNGDWPNINAIELSLTLVSKADRASTDNAPLSRTLSSFIALRNR